MKIKIYFAKHPEVANFLLMQYVALGLGLGYLIGYKHGAHK